MHAGVVGGGDSGGAQLHTGNELVEQGRLAHPAVAAEEADAVAQGIAQGIESLAGGCRDDAALIAHILIEVDHHVLQSALIVVEQVVLVEHQHHRYAVGLGRGEEAVDEGGGSLGIVDRDQEEGLVYIGGDDMAGS